MGWPITSSTPHVSAASVSRCILLRFSAPGGSQAGRMRWPRERSGLSGGDFSRPGHGGGGQDRGKPGGNRLSPAAAVLWPAPGWPRFQSGSLIPSHADPARRATRRKRARPAQTGGQKARSVPASIPEQGTAGQNRFRHQRFFGSIWCASYRGGTSTLACRHEKSPTRRAAACASTPNILPAESGARICWAIRRS